jgi:hypothetical protein
MLRDKGVSMTIKRLIYMMLLSSLSYANDCPKWFPMMMEDIIVVIPIYDKSITGADMDCDGLVDAVDPDIDGDGVANVNDAFPTDALEWTDSDGDGVGDNADKPRIALLTPNDGASNVLASANLSVKYDRFDTNITKVTGKRFKVLLADGTEHTNFNVSVAQVSITGGDTVTVNPNAHLVYGKTHYVHIDAGAFKDSTGEQNEGINTNYRWNFSVASGSGPCGCDDFDNCDLDAILQ